MYVPHSIQQGILMTSWNNIFLKIIEAQHLLILKNEITSKVIPNQHKFETYIKLFYYLEK